MVWRPSGPGQSRESASASSQLLLLLLLMMMMMVMMQLLVLMTHKGILYDGGSFNSVWKNRGVCHAAAR